MVRVARWAALGMAILISMDSSAEPWEAAAERAASDVWERLKPRVGVVTHVDADGRRVYFSGLIADPIEPGMPVIFFRAGDPAELGRGEIESGMGRLAWAGVDTSVGLVVRKDDLVRPASRLSGLAVEPFRYVEGETEWSGGVGRRMVLPRVFQGLLVAYLRTLGAGPIHISSADTPASLIGHLRKQSDTQFAATVILRDPRSGDTRFAAEYVLPDILDFQADDTEVPAFPPGRPDDPAPHTPGRAPAGVLRVSLSTAPSGPGGAPAWPPVTPADRLLLDAVSVTLNDLVEWTELPPDGSSRMYRLRIRPSGGIEEPIAAGRLSNLMNNRRSLAAARFLLGDFRFTAVSDTEIHLQTGADPVVLSQALADPIFRPVEAPLWGGDPGPGLYRIESVGPDRILLVRRASPSSGPANSRMAETVVVQIDTDAGDRQAKFELGESDLHELSDVEFSKYTGSVDYMDRIIRTPRTELQALLFNLSRMPFSEVSFRHAAARTIDRRAMLEVLLNNRGIQAEGFYPVERRFPMFPGIPQPARSVPAARRLLKSAPPVRAGLLIPDERPDLRMAAERISADLKSVGVTVRIEREAWPKYDRRLRSGEFDMAILPLLHEPAPVHTFVNLAAAFRLWLARHLSSGGPDNVTGYANSVFDVLIRPGGDIDAAHDLLMADLPVVPLFWLSKYVVLGERIERAFAPSGEWFRPQQIWMAP